MGFQCSREVRDTKYHSPSTHSYHQNPDAICLAQLPTSTEDRNRLEWLVLNLLEQAAEVGRDRRGLETPRRGIKDGMKSLGGGVFGEKRYKACFVAARLRNCWGGLQSTVNIATAQQQ